ncbi:signal peptide protein [Agrobacterium tumefaciens]|uniref:Signal peptide protein n=1 Tax=Agrobacterium tumefaciens TaxID=358 RepID=A0A0D0J7W3_AGRTU|nr:signal peptide protein [Agrobacterium tumefaciens]
MHKLTPVALLAALISVPMAAPALAIDANILRQLNVLAPEERLEQRCDIEAMERIASEQKGMKPDKVIAYAFGDPDVTSDSIKAAGAVFRSGGEWYRLRYKCQITPSTLGIRDFNYKIGEKVPEEQWAKHYLYD